MKAASPKKINIVIPVFNDWASFKRLIIDIAQTFEPHSNCHIKIFAIDDGSTQKLGPWEPQTPVGKIQEIQIIHLSCNLGHQKAIAIGMKVSARDKDCDYHVIMDSDGEDDPRDIPRLLAAAEEGQHIAVAERTNRSESRFFVLLYKIYKLIFRLILGKSISFGNYCVIPKTLIERIASSHDTWNHIAASILKSKVLIKKVPTSRGRRYFGSSSMNFTSLVLHGFSAIAVFVDVALARLLFFSLFMATISILGMFSVIAVRFLTNYAIPGWPTYTLGFAVTILVQSISLAIVALFLHLSSKSYGILLSQASSSPDPYVDFIDKVNVHGLK